MTPPYLQTPDTRLWDINVADQVFHWGPGAHELACRTIAFFPEVEALLEDLVDEFGGLPDFSALLFLYACSIGRASASALGRRAFTIRPMVSTVDAVSQVPKIETDQASVEQTTRFRNFFVSLRELSTYQDAGLSRVLIAAYRDILAKHAVPFPSQGNGAVFRFLRTPAVDQPRAESDFDLLAPHTTTITGNESVSGFVGCWNLLDELQQSEIDLDSIKLKLETGVDQLPPPAESVEFDRHGFDALITRLESDEELGEVSRAARYVASVAALPLSPSEPAELPIGGVSDITNRGSPERLLMTELAADPMLLVARIATGQALYLRRETPPSRGKLSRTILIESSVRTWGQTRVRALAVAMGLAATEQANREASVEIMTLGTEPIVEDFSNKLGLTKHLSRLTGTRHPGDALKRWATRDREEQETPVLVLSERTHGDDSFRSVLRELEKDFIVVTIDHRGDVRMIRSDSMGETELRRLRVDELKLGEPKRASLAMSAEDDPAFVRLPRCPLRFANNASPKWCAAAGTSGLWVRTPDQRLLFYDRENKGGLLVLDRLACDFFSGELKAWRAVGAVLELVHESRRNARYVRIDAYDGIARDVSLERRNEYLFDLDSLFARDDSRLYLLNKMTGEDLDSHLIDPDETVAGTPFRRYRLKTSEDRDVIGIANQSGNQLLWHRFLVPKGELGREHSPPPMGFRGAQNEPVLIDSHLSRIHSLGDNPSAVAIEFLGRPYYLSPKLVRVASDGQRVIVSAEMRSDDPEKRARKRGATKARLCVNVKSGKVSNVPPDPSGLSELMPLKEPALKFYEQVETFARFTRARVSNNGLVLVPRKNRTPMLVIARDQIGFHTVVDSSESGGVSKPFGERLPVPLNANESRRHLGPPHTHWGLRRLEMGKATLWLDSRGLLHFAIREDPRQLTIVIQSQANLLGGWFSDCGVFGSPYYHERPSDLKAPPFVFDWYRRWLELAREA